MMNHCREKMKRMSCYERNMELERVLKRLFEQYEAAMAAFDEEERPVRPVAIVQ